MTPQPLPDNHFHSLRAHYEIVVPPTMSLLDGICALERNMKKAFSEQSGFAAPRPVETRWEGKEYCGRDLVFFDAAFEGPQNIYAVFEFDKRERNFYVRDTSRHMLNREVVCRLLEQQEYVFPSHPDA